MAGENRKKRFDKILDILKSWKGKKPDYDNLEPVSDPQTEEAYQEEQAKWLDQVRQKKAGHSTDKNQG